MSGDFPPDVPGGSGRREAAPPETGPCGGLARSVHNLSGAKRSSSSFLGVASWCLLLLSSLSLVGGVGCGPVVPETPTQHPPYIDPDSVSPSGSRLTVFPDQAGNARLSVDRLYDPNEEDELYYAWFSDRDRLLREFNVPRTGTATLNGTRYHTYEGVSWSDFDPASRCSDGISATETIWLYVSDGPFRRVGNAGVEPGRGSFMVSHSWVVDYECGT